MLNFELIRGIKEINSAESFFGMQFLFCNRLVIPFFNLSINKGHDNLILNTTSSKYLNYGYLIFINVENISTKIKKEDNTNFITECYGGINVFDNEYYEYWISYSKGYIALIKNEYSFSNSPFKLDNIKYDFYRHLPKEFIFDPDCWNLSDQEILK